MEVAHMCDVSGLSPRAVFERLREAGLGSTPGTAAEVLHDGVRERISPNKLPVARWVEVIEACHAEGIRSTVTVMFGHIEEPWELAEHMRVVRELQERTAGFTEFVPLSFIPFHTLLGRTHGSRRSPARRTSSTPRRSGSRSAARSEPPGELGEDGPRCRHRGAALGRQRPRRDADGGEISRIAGSYHGVKLDPEDLIAAAHRAGRPGRANTLYEIRRRYELPARV
jgi:FO synthase